MIMGATKILFAIGLASINLPSNSNKRINLLSITNSTHSSLLESIDNSKFVRMLVFFGTVYLAYESYKNCSAFFQLRKFLASLERDFNVE
jgi:hypothetical protein